MNAYPVAMPSDALNDISMIQPTGNPVYQEQKEYIPARKHKKTYSSSIPFSEGIKL